MSRPTSFSRARDRTLLVALSAPLVMNMLSGCAARLKPADLPIEQSVLSAEAPLWSALAAIRPGDWFQLQNTGEQAIAWRLRAIDSAVESIALQSFIWKDDRTGSRILGRVLAAADRGVDVRILLDDSFLAGEDVLASAVNRHPNIEYRVYNPLVNRKGGMAVRELANIASFHRIDRRMHNKLLVVDDRVAIIGGRNMADEYYGYHEQHNFRDMEVLLGGPFVTTLGNAFDEYWNNHWSIPIDRITEQPAHDRDLADLRISLAATADSGLPESETDLQREWEREVRGAAEGTARLLIDTTPVASPGKGGEEAVQLAGQFVRELDSVEKEAILVTAYFIPTPDVIDSMERLAQRGVQLIVLTNSLNSNNHVTAHSAYQHHRREVLRIGAKLFETRADAKDRDRYMQQPVADRILGLHAKLAVLDHERLFIGSANLDPRSLRVNSEIGIVIESRELNRRLRKHLTLDFSERNAWQVESTAEGRMFWVSDNGRSEIQPASSFFLRLENAFFGLLPIEGEM